ncbi:MAG TPA: T9SS type A sorting domain-containing protein, partial [Cytophagales bacterium]
AKFTVRPLDNLPAGTRIENFADIFFDYNPPVRTNTVFNTLGVLPTEAPGGDAVAITICRPNLPVSAGPDRFFCDQDSVQLQAQSPQYGQGRWKRISGAGTLAEAANPYSTVTGLGIGANVFEWSIPDNSCAGDSLHSRVTMTRYASPPKPAIAYVGTIELTSSTEGPHYRWYYNGRLLPDDARSIEATRGGSYTVSVANDQCASALSDPFAFELTSPVLTRLLKLAPNPTDGPFAVALPEGVTEATFTVFDALGREVLHRVARGSDGTAMRQSFDLRPNGAGVYLLKIQTPKAVVVRRIVVGR